MYTEHWGLNASPFSGTGGRKTFFESDAQAEAIARIDYLINNNRRLGLLLGDEGLGKSTILNHVRRQLRRRRRTMMGVWRKQSEASKLQLAFIYELKHDQITTHDSTLPCETLMTS